MEHCEAEKILQRLRGEYRRNTVEKKLDKSGEDEEGESDTAQLIVRRNVTGPDPNPVPPLRFHKVDMDGNSKGKGKKI